MKNVWRRLREFSRKRDRQEQLAYLGQMLDRFGDDSRVERIVARVASSHRVSTEYGPDHYTGSVKRVLHLPGQLVDREPHDTGTDPRDDVATILESLNHPDQLLVRMAYGIGRKRLTQVQIARKLGCTVRTIYNRLRVILAAVRIRADG